MKSVLFVCLGNSCRSQMAEGFARHHGSDVLHPASAGLAAIAIIDPDTRAAMLERGIDLSAQFPKQFEPRSASDFDVVVNMSGYELPACPGPQILEWEVEDPFGDEIAVHRRVRDHVESLVKQLISELRETGEVGQRIAPEAARKPRLWQRFTKWR